VKATSPNPGDKDPHNMDGEVAPIVEIRNAYKILVAKFQAQRPVRRLGVGGSSVTIEGERLWIGVFWLRGASGSG